MAELKYIRKVDEKHPYDYENPPVCKVELWDFSKANENEEARKEAVCLVASISYGNEYCKDPDKLWNLLIERGHESPFEFIKTIGDAVFGCKVQRIVENLREEPFPDGVSAYIPNYFISTFKLKVPIFVARQIQRHRAFSYMEMSRRYVKGDKVEFEFWQHSNALINFVKIYYNSLLEKGLRPEVARANLLLGLYTTFWMQGDYKAWLNFFIHRLHPEAQEETRLVAKSMWDLLKEDQPEIIEAMADYLESWTKECNPIFTPAREKKAEWFSKNFLEGK